MIDPKAIRVFSRSFESNVSLLPIGDLHIDANCNLRELSGFIQEILKNDYYTFLIGDIFDVGFFDRVRDQQEREMNLNEAMRRVKAIFKPLKDRILCVVGGNHDRRVERYAGFDIVEEFCDDLGVPYAPGQAILSLKLRGNRWGHGNGNTAYVFALTHGWGGGRTKGGKYNKVNLFANMWEGVDFFVIGHVHEPISGYSSRFRFDTRTNSISKVRRKLIVLSAFQGYGMYASQNAFEPTANPQVIIQLSNRRKEFDIIERSPLNEIHSSTRR